MLDMFKRKVSREFYSVGCPRLRGSCAGVDGLGRSSFGGCFGFGDFAACRLSVAGPGLQDINF